MRRGNPIGELMTRGMLVGLEEKPNENAHFMTGRGACFLCITNRLALQEIGNHLIGKLTFFHSQPLSMH